MRAGAAQTPILRSRELAQVEEVLGRPEPSVVTISGPTGIGKSSLLAVIRERALATGRHVVGEGGGSGPGTLAVTGQMTMLELAAAIVDDLEPSTATRTAGESARAARRGDQRSHAGSAAPQFLPPIERASAVLEDQHRPVALLFDAYRPALEVDEKLAAIVARVRSRRAPVVIVLSDRQPETTVLGATAEVKLSLGAFDESELRAYLVAAAEGVDPPVTSEELEVYVEAARSKPHLVDSFGRLFAFLATDSPPAEAS